MKFINWTGHLVTLNTAQTITGAKTFNADVTLGAAKHLILPLHDDAATPTLAFGDGNSGFYEVTDNTISCAIAGVRKWSFGSSYFGGYVAYKPALRYATASQTVPNILPNYGDATTGIGWKTTGELCLVAGSAEGVRVENPATLGATETSLWLFDDDNNAIEQVTVGAADSGGAGFKVLRVPN